MIATLTAWLATVPSAAARPACSERRIELRVSRSPDRSAARPLCRREIRGEVYIFVAPGRGIDRVSFTVDGTRFNVEENRPWDLVGGDRAVAVPFDADRLSPGGHVVRATVTRSDGRTVRVYSSFTVEGGSGAPPSEPPPPDDPAGCDGVRVEPGSGTLQQAANQREDATTFCLEAGTYTITSTVVLEDGDRVIGAGPDRTFVVGDGTVHHLIAGAANAHFAVGSFDISGAAGSGACAPDCGRAFKPSDGITMRNVRCHDNDNQCIGGGGGDTVVQDSVIYRNGLDPGFHGISAAGIKRIGGTIRVSDSVVRDNGGNGVWCDSCDGGTFLVESSTITGNARKGINYEISGGFDAADRAIIRNNVITGNNTEELSTAAGVAVMSSQDVEIYGNTFGANGDGRAVLVFDDERSFVVRNVEIHDNTLNGDVVEGCGIAGVTCSGNG